MAKNIQVNDRSVRVQIWDTAGQEAFRSITRSYYKSSTCAFIVYDITSKKTFTNVVSWSGGISLLTSGFMHTPNYAYKYV